MEISVIIPCYNGSLYIDPLLDSLKLLQDLSIDYEILVVDNGSTDDSLFKLKNGADIIPRLRILEFRDRKGSYAARNAAVKMAQGDVLVFTDIDCRPEPDWLRKLAEYLLNTPTDRFLVSGSVQLFSCNPVVSLYEELDLMFGINQESYSKTQTGATANLAVSRILFNEVGGFRDIQSGGDTDFCKRVMQTGDVVFSFLPDWRVLHPARATKHEIYTKARRVGGGIAALAVEKKLSPFWFLLRQFVGLVAQPHQVSMGKEVLRKWGVFNSRAWGLITVIWKVGWVSRVSTIRHYLRSREKRTI